MKLNKIEPQNKRNIYIYLYTAVAVLHILDCVRVFPSRTVKTFQSCLWDKSIPWVLLPTQISQP